MTSRRRPPAPTITESGAVVGRPRKVPPEDAEQRIEDFAADGFSHLGVAMKLGCAPAVLSRWMDENADLKAAFDRGRERERHTLHNTLYRTATEGTGKDALIAAMFLLKSRHGYREGDQGEQANRVSITFQLPGAMKPAEFVEEVKRA